MASLTRTYTQKKLLGKVYTPAHIVEKILDEVGIQGPGLLGKSILDPACGDGRFLIEVVQRIIHFSPIEHLTDNLNQVHGWDVDKAALADCKAALDELVAPFGVRISWNLSKKDALLLHRDTRQFDFIIGNPPYIRIQHLPETQRVYLQSNYHFCRSGSTDTFVAFFELSHRLLSPIGRCGFITPNSYFFSETARPLRRYFEEKQNLYLITNYGSVRVFDNTGTYAAITIFGTLSTSSFCYEVSNEKFEYQRRQIGYDELKQNDLWQLSVQKASQEEGARLGDLCRISVGVTTLSDKIYLFRVQKYLPGGLVSVVSKNGVEAILEKEILKPIIKASRLKKEDTGISEYILFPYQKNEAGKNTILSETKLKTNFPQAYAYLVSQKGNLDRRDNGKKNAVAWYAFGRAQSLDTCFGKKIIFSPMNREPNFIFSENPDALIYSGYFIKYDGEYSKLLAVLNSAKMADYMAIAGRDFRGGWKGYSKKILENFRINPAELE